MQKMASSSPKFVCLFFLLTTLLFSLQTYARDSQFFSKVTRNRDEDTTTTPNTNKFFINNKENDEFVHLNKLQEQEQQPTFIPQTTETGYGLYGHETGLDPPSTTTTTSTSTSLYNMDENNNKNNNFDNNFNNYFQNNNEDHHEKNYAPELKGLSSTSTYGTNDVAPTKYINNNNFNDEGKFYEANKDGKYNYNGFNSEERYVPNNNFYNNNYEGNKLYGARYNGMHEKQGLSDTRFLENGKYYYDVHNEETYNNNPKNNNYMSHTNNFNNNNNYENNNGYYGNNKETNYVNNNNKFYKGNGMKGYQSQIPEEERFDFDEQP